LRAVEAPVSIGKLDEVEILAICPAVFPDALGVIGPGHIQAQARSEDDSAQTRELHKIASIDLDLAHNPLPKSKPIEHPREPPSPALSGRSRAIQPPQPFHSDFPMTLLGKLERKSKKQHNGTKRQGVKGLCFSPSLTLHPYCVERALFYYNYKFPSR